MKKALLSAVCGLLFTAGIVQAQVVVRIGPPPPQVEVRPAYPHGHPDWVCVVDTTIGMVHATSGFPAATSLRLAAVPSG